MDISHLSAHLDSWLLELKYVECDIFEVHEPFHEPHNENA
jgi:hypothetical protein